MTTRMLSLRLLTPLALAHGLLAQSPPTNYQALTNPFGNQTNFNVETVRGLSFAPGALEFWAINTHGSMLVRMTKPGGVPQVERYRTINNPVALAQWSDPSGGARLLVVGGGTHGLAMHDAASGDVDFYANLPSEPRDIVVDPSLDVAYVSCGNEDVVVRIDLVQTLVTNALVATEIAVDGTRPTFLSFEPGTPSVPGVVRVAPMLSGNNTTFAGSDTGANVVRLPDAPQPQSGPATVSLPDLDLFEITSSTGPVTATPIVAGAGTLLMAHGEHRGSYWMLATESRNVSDNEPSINGSFAENRLVIVPPVASSFSSSPNFGAQPMVLSLDTITPAAFPPAMLAGEPSPNKPVAMPWDIAFHPGASYTMAVVSGSASDTLRVLAQLAPGALPIRVKDIALPSGSIPRSLQFGPNGDTLWVYCWGTNRVLEFDFNAILTQTTTSWIAEWDLGPDPQPEAVRNGRRIWYDADNSANRGLTCNHCHPGGGMDLLGWQLSDEPFDHKDVMVTQSLKSIEDTFPYHWRGERNLADFNGAFSGLLGGADLNAVELEDFEEFVFSLQAPANPRQNVDRQLVANAALGTNGVIGQADYTLGVNRIGAFEQSSCVACHGLETGASGMITQDNAMSFVPTNTNMDAAHLRQLDDKLRQPAVTYTNAGGLTVERPRGGWGLSHNGDDVGADGFLDTTVFLITPPEQAQISEFVRQFDQGIAPRVHEAFLMNASTALGDAASFGLLVQTQAAAMDPWFGVAVVGRSSAGQELQLHRDGGTYLDQNGIGYAFADLWNDAQGGGSFLFVLVPPGNARRFAVDPDNDGLDSGAEIAAGLDPMRADSDGDTWIDGYEVLIGTDPTTTTSKGTVQTMDFLAPQVSSAEFDFETARLARFRVAYSEPVRVSVQVLRRVPNVSPPQYVPFGAPQVHRSFVREHALVVQELLPSMPDMPANLPGIPAGPVPPEEYQFELTLSDYAGNSTTTILQDASGSSYVVPTDDTVLAVGSIGFPAIITSDLLVTRPAGPGGSVNVRVDLSDLWDFAAIPGSNAGNMYVVAQVSTVNAAGDRTLQVPTPLGATVRLPVGQLNASIATVLSGDVLVARAGAAAGGVAQATFSFDIPGFVALGTDVVVSIVGVTPDDPSPGGNSLAPVSRSPIWMMPMSPASGRLIRFPY